MTAIGIPVVDAADRLSAERDELALEASFAPPVTTYAQCSCGSTFESRCNAIAITKVELDAATAAADGDLNLAIDVISAINSARFAEDHAALADWEDMHAYCRDDLGEEVW